MIAAILTVLASMVGVCACCVGVFIAIGLLMFTILPHRQIVMAPIEAMTKLRDAKGQWLITALFVFVVGLWCQSRMIAHVSKCHLYVAHLMSWPRPYFTATSSWPRLQAADGTGYPPPPDAYPPAGNYPSTPMGLSPEHSTP